MMRLAGDDATFLDAMDIRASIDPCELLRGDLLRLLALAGFRGSAIYDDMAARGDIVLVDAGGVRAAIAWARSPA